MVNSSTGTLLEEGLLELLAIIIIPEHIIKTNIIKPIIIFIFHKLYLLLLNYSIQYNKL